MDMGIKGIENEEDNEEVDANDVQAEFEYTADP